MKIKILTLFPEMFDGFLATSIIKRALNAKKLSIELINIRDYAENKHKQVDDSPYGGGAGMLMMIEPLVKAIRANKSVDTKVLLTSTQGAKFNQKMAQKLAEEAELMIICGRYEGIDARISAYIDQEISVGDYVLTGGELPAMIICEAISRLSEEVISEASLVTESFNEDLLEAPQYTKPAEFEGMKVPEVLLSGHHENIKVWQKKQALDLTRDKRPDLYRQYLAGESGYIDLLAEYDCGLVFGKDYNCAEKVINLSNLVLALGLDEKAVKAAAGFGGGMAIQHLCGAVAGAVMVLSLCHVETVAHQSNIYSIEAAFLNEVKEQLGSLNCDELKERHYSSATKCEHIIRTVIEILGKYVNEHV